MSLNATLTNSILRNPYNLPVSLVTLCRVGWTRGAAAILPRALRACTI